MDYDQTTMPMAYDAGRAYAPKVLEFWLNTISSKLLAHDIKDILDLGCGTGRFSGALAAHFRAPVVAVDPSEKMLVEAWKKKAAGVHFIRGLGEALPLIDASVDMVFISMVFHHFETPHRAIEECHRVLRAEGVVCLRAAVTDRINAYPYVPFFPRTSSLFAAHLQGLAYIEDVFSAGGFQLNHHEVVMSEVAANWLAYAKKIEHRADSILARLTDQEFEEGLSVLRGYAGAQTSDQPVIEPVDFLVLQRM